MFNFVFPVVSRYHNRYKLFPSRFCVANSFLQQEILRVTGFEPMTSCSQNRCATGLRYTLSTTYLSNLLSLEKCIIPGNLTHPVKCLSTECHKKLKLETLKHNHVVSQNFVISLLHHHYFMMVSFFCVSLLQY